jgi:hypothetical protein
MDYIEPSSALAAISNALEHAIIPELQPGPARGQVWSAIGLLTNLAIEMKGPGVSDPASHVDGSWLERTEALIEDLEASVGRQARLHSLRALAQ